MPLHSPDGRWRQRALCIPLPFRSLTSPGRTTAACCAAENLPSSSRQRYASPNALIMGAAGGSVRILSRIGPETCANIFRSIPARLPIEADSCRFEAEASPRPPVGAARGLCSHLGTLQRRKILRRPLPDVGGCAPAPTVLRRQSGNTRLCGGH